MLLLNGAIRWNFYYFDAVNASPRPPTVGQTKYDSVAVLNSYAGPVDNKLAEMVLYYRKSSFAIN